MQNVYQSRANAKQRLLDRKGALGDYNKAIKIDPHFAEAYFNRGILEIRMGDKNNACRDLYKAGELGFEEAFEAIEDYCH